VNISWKNDTLEGKRLLQWDYEVSFYFFLASFLYCSNFQGEKEN